MPGVKTHSRDKFITAPYAAGYENFVSSILERARMTMVEVADDLCSVPRQKYWFDAVFSNYTTTHEPKHGSVPLYEPVFMPMLLFSQGLGGSSEDALLVALACSSLWVSAHAFDGPHRWRSKRASQAA